ncbi:hypothetical protein B0I08_1021, partial [Glaciihabitans tibetensis]
MLAVLSLHLGTALALAIAPAPVPGTPAAGVCDSGNQTTSGCPNVDGSIQDENAVLDGSEGGPGAVPTTPPRTPPRPTSPPTASTPAPATDPAAPPFWDEFVIVEPVTLEDIASFHPDTGTTQMEPNGWTIAGLPT